MYERRRGEPRRNKGEVIGKTPAGEKAQRTHPSDSDNRTTDYGEAFEENIQVVTRSGVSSAWLNSIKTRELTHSPSA